MKLLKKSTKMTDTSEYSNTMSRISQRNKFFYSDHNNSRFNAVGNKTYDHQQNQQVKNIQISIRKSSYSPHRKQKIVESQLPRVNPNKFRVDIKSIVLKQQTNQKIKIGISNCKGFKNTSNLHQIGIYLGMYNYIFLTEGYDGNFASKTIKDIFPTQFTKLSEKCINEYPEKIINKIYRQIHKKIIEQQKKIKNNSGASLISIFCLDKLIVAANCGGSKAICCTKRGQLLDIGRPHLTSNQEQINRIFKAGGKLYQTVLQVPQQKGLKLGGPLRLSESGLFYTRTLGKINQYQKMSNETRQSLIFTPQITYINRNQVEWIAIISENIIRYCEQSRIKQCIQEQTKLLSQRYGYNQIAKQCSRKLMSQMLAMGISDAITIIIIFPDTISMIQLQTVSDCKSSNNNKNVSFYSQITPVSNRKYSNLANSQRSFIFKK